MQQANISAERRPVDGMPIKEEEEKLSSEICTISWEEALRREREYRRKVTGAPSKQSNDPIKTNEAPCTTPADTEALKVPMRYPDVSWKSNKGPADNHDIRAPIRMQNHEPPAIHPGHCRIFKAPTKNPNDSQYIREGPADNPDISYPVPMQNHTPVQGQSVNADDAGRQRTGLYSKAAVVNQAICNQQSSDSQHHKIPRPQKLQPCIPPLQAQNPGPSGYSFAYQPSKFRKAKHRQHSKRAQFGRAVTKNRSSIRQALPKLLQNYHCHVCNVSLVDPDNFRQHCEGKKHKSNVIASLQGGKELPTSNTDIVWCRECNIPCMNKVSLGQHQLGKKHLARIAMLALRTTSATSSKDALDVDKNVKVLELLQVKTGIELNISHGR